MGAEVEDGTVPGERNRDRDPGVGDLASGRRVDGDLPGGGRPVRERGDPAAASPDCGHTYTRSSAGQPGGAFQATATITWDVTWHGAGGAGGALAPLFTTAVAAFRLAESQALNTSGGA